MNMPKIKIDSVINVWRRNKTKIGDDVIKVKYFGFFSLLLFGNFDLIYYTYVKVYGLKTGSESFEAQVRLKCKALSHTKIWVRRSSNSSALACCTAGPGSIQGSAPLCRSLF
jgi:hypothetical protein